MLRADLGSAEVLVTSRAEGDARNARSWGWILPRQVHGAGVVHHRLDGGADGEEADAVVSDDPTAVLAVLGADCPLVGLSSPEGILAVAHAGWRGLVAGVLEATVAAMRERGASGLDAVLGPCIGPECYPFSDDDLDEVAAHLGEEVRAVDRFGAPALDLPAAVEGGLAGLGVSLTARLGGCTACSTDWFSYRARHDDARHALAVSASPIGWPA